MEISILLEAELSNSSVHILFFSQDIFFNKRIFSWFVQYLLGLFLFLWSFEMLRGHSAILQYDPIFEDET